MSLGGTKQPSERKEGHRFQEGCGGIGKRYPTGKLSEADIFHGSIERCAAVEKMQSPKRRRTNWQSWHLALGAAVTKALSCPAGPTRNSAN